MLSRTFILIAWVCFIHVAGIYLFTQGFLLRRLALSEFNDCSHRPCTLPPTHKRAVLLIIDALRFDFLSPDPPLPHSPFHHHILTLPQTISASHPRNSLIFNAYVDPPTTTLQRINALTTGSLPSFVEMGSNFGGSSIADDSMIKQLRTANKTLAFMGDDTWMNLYPDVFHPNMTFPYDSFNVEDLHTVDEGVIRHLFPLLGDKSKPFDFLIGHFLGVDHVGHRAGPDHPLMKKKLQQMNDVLTRVVEVIDEDTLLVVLGDHGMDRSGDHGGDEELETSAGVWIYSKGAPIAPSATYTIPSDLTPLVKFPGATISHRSIQQIDLIPTISLLLGLPIPFSNLGSAIPEVFMRDPTGQHLNKALEINALQIKGFLDSYRASPSGAELDKSWSELGPLGLSIREGNPGLEALYTYNRMALAICRTIWAQFDIVSMSLGLALLVAGVLTTWALYFLLAEVRVSWDSWLRSNLVALLRGLASGAVLGVLISQLLERFALPLDALDWIIFTAPFVSTAVFIMPSAVKFTSTSLRISVAPFVLGLHSIAFFSNSFTFWEDRIVPFLLISCIVPHVLVGFTAPTPQLRNHILSFSLLFAVCVRLMAISTICREEQQPYCHVTFFASSSLPSPPLPVLILMLPSSVALPYVIQKFLQNFKSNCGLAGIFLPICLRAALVGGNLYWLIEWMEIESFFDPAWAPTLRSARTHIAQLTMTGVLFGGMALWWFFPLRLEINDRRIHGKRRQVTVASDANTFGSRYLVFWTILLGVVCVVTQPTGQIVLGLGVISLLSYLEILNGVREVEGQRETFGTGSLSATKNSGVKHTQIVLPKFSEVAPLALLALHAFYGTGHQSTISSIQWKSAFVLTPTVTYPFSPLTVAVNFFGPILLFVLAAPLLASWNRALLPPSNPRLHIARVAVSVMLYYACLLLASAASATLQRRHLMAWKVFAPRFMAAAADLVAVDLGVLIGAGIGAERILRKITIR